MIKKSKRKGLINMSATHANCKILHTLEIVSHATGS